MLTLKHFPPERHNSPILVWPSSMPTWDFLPFAATHPGAAKGTKGKQEKATGNQRNLKETKENQRKQEETKGNQRKPKETNSSLEMVLPGWQGAAD